MTIDKSVFNYYWLFSLHNILVHSCMCVHCMKYTVTLCLISIKEPVLFQDEFGVYARILSQHIQSQ